MFLLKVGWRYAFSRSNRHNSVSIVIVIGIAIGLLALLTLLSVMNALQYEQLDHIRSIDSFHIQLKTNLQTHQVKEHLKEIQAIEHMYQFVDTQSIVSQKGSSQSVTARLRIIEPSFLTDSNPFKSNSSLWTETSTTATVAMGLPLSYAIGVRPNEQIGVTFIAPGKTVTLSPQYKEISVDSLFRSHLDEFDQKTIIIADPEFLHLYDQGRHTYGIYLTKRDLRKVGSVVKQIQNILPESEVLSWQQLNSALYSALLLEKMLMYLFLWLMFFIIAINLKSASMRLVYVKQRELAILRSLGVRKEFSSHLFVVQGAFITLLGEAIGLMLSFVVIRNFNTILHFADRIYFMIYQRHSAVLLFPFQTYLGVGEVIGISVGVCALSLFFSYLGARSLLKKEPMEIVRNE
ncbi:MAG: ABC transporter permease [Sphaerochaetaceae bacterium]|jgi:lipoprotein-releasing system permease protein